MKKALKYFIPSVLVLLFLSCEKEEDSFDETLLIGKWESGTLYYRYDADYTGATWDESDDVSEDEAQEFEWELVKSELAHYHIMEIGGTVPKIYTVIRLTSTKLEYQDDFGKKFSFTKVNN